MVCRNTTERPEGLKVGLARLVDMDVKRHFAWANDSPKWSGDNPYGKGDASIKIIDSIIFRRRFFDLVKTNPVVKT